MILCRHSNESMNLSRFQNAKPDFFYYVIDDWTSSVSRHLVFLSIEIREIPFVCLHNLDLNGLIKLQYIIILKTCPDEPCNYNTI